MEKTNEVVESDIIVTNGKKFSNSLINACQTKCKVCGKQIKLRMMRGHTKSRHNMIITDYKNKFNQHNYDQIDPIFHNCGICGDEIMLDSDAIANHLRIKHKTHKITHREYNEAYMVRVKDVQNTRRIKEKHLDKTYEQDIVNKTNTYADTNMDLLFEAEPLETTTKEKDPEQKSVEILDVTIDDTIEDTIDETLGETAKSGEHAIKESRISEDNTALVARFRRFVVLINSSEEETSVNVEESAGKSGYPSIEEILGMDTSSEEAIIRYVMSSNQREEKMSGVPGAGLPNVQKKPRTRRLYQKKCVKSVNVFKDTPK